LRSRGKCGIFRRDQAFHIPRCDRVH
jgi:hypothetical protein